MKLTTLSTNRKLTMRVSLKVNNVEYPVKKLVSLTEAEAIIVYRGNHFLHGKNANISHGSRRHAGRPAVWLSPDPMIVSACVRARACVYVCVCMSECFLCVYTMIVSARVYTCVCVYACVCA